MFRTLTGSDSLLLDQALLQPLSAAFPGSDSDCFASMAELSGIL